MIEHLNRPIYQAMRDNSIEFVRYVFSIAQAVVQTHGILHVAIVVPV